MIKMYLGVHIKYPLFLLDFSETVIFSNFSKNEYFHEILCLINIKFHEHPSGVSRVVPC